MMDLSDIDVFCLTATCGDPVPNFGGPVHYTKRRMVFSGVTFTGAAVYRCPVCGSTRKFKTNFFSNGYHEVP